MLTRADLVADCARCRALCCVGPVFAPSADFPVAKPAGTPCPNLRDDHRCGIHERLREEGFRGCVAYDCAGAGQALVAAAGPGVPDAALHAALPAVRLLHELAAHLLEVLDAPAAAGRHAAAHDLLAAVSRTASAPLAVTAGAAEELRGRVAPVLRAASALVRAAAGGPGRDLSRADLAGAALARADLRRADLRGAVLVGADLRRADLRGADLLGADLRGADLAGADLRGALFVVRPQLHGAAGDPSTRLPAGAVRPAHWRA